LPFRRKRNTLGPQKDVQRMVEMPSVESDSCQEISTGLCNGRATLGRMEEQEYHGQTLMGKVYPYTYFFGLSIVR
jgi:hypothetical protein